MYMGLAEGLTMDMQHKWALLDIMNHEEKLDEDKREELLDKELMTEEDFLRYYGRTTNEKA